MRNQPNAGYIVEAALLSVKKLLSKLFVLLLILSSSNYVTAQCPLTCKGNANVSLGVDGTSTVTIFTVMNNPPPSCIPNYQITLTNSLGNPVSNPLTCANLGQTIMYSVLDITNGNSCWGNLFVEDKLPPLLLCSDITIECNDPAEVDSIGKPLVTDNCDPAPQILSQGEVVTQIDCDNTQGILYSITRNWIAKDAKGNFSLPCSQKISIRKPNINLVQYPPNYTQANGNFLDCTVSNTSPDTLGEPTYKGKPLTLMCKIIYTHSDSVVMRCRGSRTILRLWTVLDCCTNTINTHLQVIDLLDKTPPVAICPPDFIVPTPPGLCTADVLLPLPMITDNCSDSISINITGSGFGALGVGPYLDVLPGFYEVNYHVCDGCNNCTVCQVAFEVKELELPVVICNNEITLTLNGSGVASIEVDDINNGTFDNCCLDSLDIKLMGQSDSFYTQQINFGCADVNQSFLVILRAMDCHGNANFCMASVHIVDTLGPSISCPDDVTVLCNTPIIPDSTGFAIAGDICGIDSLYFTDSLFLNPCNTGSIIRYWTAIDGAGNIASCTQLISIIDTTAPVITFPPDITINCLLSPDSTLTGSPNIQDECSLFLISHIDDYINVIGACNRIERTWVILNLCDTSLLLHVQNIVLYDSAPPVWQTKPGVLDLTVECDEDVFVPVPIAADDCTFVNVIKVLDVTVPTCPNKYTRTISYRAVDGCENQSIPYIVKIVVNDIKAPVLNNCPLDTIVLLPADSCAKYLSFPIITATDNCNDVIITNTSQFAANNISGNISGTYPIGVHVVNIFADDQCGNRDTCTVTIDVRDVTPPSADCSDITISIVASINATDSLYVVNPALILQDYNVFEKCSDIFISADPDTFDCNDAGPPPKLFTITIQDAFGNTTLCPVQVLIVDSFNVCGLSFNDGNLIMGHLTTPSLLPIKNATVDIGMNNVIDQVKTDEYGYYVYPHIPNGTDVNIHPWKNDDYENGVDVLDLIYLTKYILGVNKLPHPYSKLAGDVNESHSLSVGDLGEIRRLILQDQTSFSCGKSWKFIDAKCQGDIISNGLSPSLPESLVIPDISYHSILNDFIAVKLGDVDFSSKSYHATGDLEVRNSDKAILEIPEVIMEKGKSYTVNIKLKDSELWSGLQAGLMFPDEIVIEHIKPGNINNMKEENIYSPKLSGNIINFLWNTNEEVNRNDQNDLVQLTISSSVEGKLSQFLHLNNETFNNLSYDRTMLSGDIELSFIDKELNTKKPTVRIYSNRPNPFNSETIWPVFSEGLDNKLTFALSSSDGKLIMNKEVILTEGYNELKLDSKDLPGKGIYLYQIITNDSTLSGKIILH